MKLLSDWTSTSANIMGMLEPTELSDVIVATHSHLPGSAMLPVNDGVQHKEFLRTLETINHRSAGHLTPLKLYKLN